MELKTDEINHPVYYAETNLSYKQPECIDLTRLLPFCVGNAIKYVWRAGHKGAAWQEDLKKAKWYYRDRGCSTTFEQQEQALALLELYDFDGMDDEWLLKIKIIRHIITRPLVNEVIEKEFHDLADYFTEQGM